MRQRFLGDFLLIPKADQQSFAGLRRALEVYGDRAAFNLRINCRSPDLAERRILLASARRADLNRPVDGARTAPDQIDLEGGRFLDRAASSGRSIDERQPRADQIGAGVARTDPDNYRHGHGQSDFQVGDRLVFGDLV